MSKNSSQSQVLGNHSIQISQTYLKRYCIVSIAFPLAWTGYASFACWPHGSQHTISLVIPCQIAPLGLLTHSYWPPCLLLCCSGAISYSRDLPGPGIQPKSPALQADSWLNEPPGKPAQRSYRVQIDAKVEEQLKHLSRREVIGRLWWESLWGAH